MYDVIDIKESIQASSGIMPATKKGKLQLIVHQVNGEKQVHTLWPVKFCPMAGANLFSPTCELSHRNNTSSDHFNNIMVNTPSDDIVLDCPIKTPNGWVAKVDFLQASNSERAASPTALPKRDINDLHIV